jgi:hypothetical protein
MACCYAPKEVSHPAAQARTTPFTISMMCSTGVQIQYSIFNSALMNDSVTFYFK